MTASSWGKYFQIFLLLAVTKTVVTLEVSIQSIKPVHRVNEEFISLSIDPDILLKNEITSEKALRMLVMARALSPAYLRLAGPKTSLYHFANKNSIGNNTSITESQVEAVVKFARAANLRLVVAVSAATRKEDGSWDDSQTKRFLKFADFLALDISLQMGFDRPRAEPSVSGVSLGNDIDALARLLNLFPRYRHALILGPDIGNLDSDREIKRNTDIIKVAGDSLSAITWHPTPFILHPSNDVEKIVDRASGAIDDLNRKTRQLHNMLRSTVAVTKHIWLGETSTTSNHGRFVDALMWVSRLGQAAKLDINTVMHSPIFDELVNPTPEFWASVLYRQLVGRDVLDTRLHSGDRRRVHAFAHCSRDGATSGGVTLFAVNYSPYSVSANLKSRWAPQTKNGIRRYVLTSPKDPLSSNILLNGKPLELLPSGDVPIFEPELISTNEFSTNIYIPALSITFWEIPSAYAKACMPMKTYKKSDIIIKRRISNRTKREAMAKSNIPHVADVMTTHGTSFTDQLDEGDYMNPGGSIYAFLSPPIKDTETVKIEPFFIEPDQYNAEIESEHGTDTLSPAELHFCYEKIQPTDIYKSNIQDAANINYDDLFAAEYEKFMDKDEIKLDEKPSAKKEITIQSEMNKSNEIFVKTKIENSLLPSSLNNISKNDVYNKETVDKTKETRNETNTRNNKVLDKQNKISLNNIDIDLNDDTKYSSPYFDNIQTDDILIDLNGVLDYESAIDDASQIRNSSVLNQNIPNEESAARKEAPEINISALDNQNKSCLNVNEVTEKMYSNENKFDINLNKTSNDDDFNKEIIIGKEHNVPKRDLQRYKNFLHHKNYLKLKDLSSIKPEKNRTENTTTVSSPVTTQLPLLEKNVIKNNSTTMKSKNIIKTQTSKIPQKSFSIETLKESQQRRRERLNKLKEKVSAMLKNSSLREKRQTDDTGEDDDYYPELPISEIPKSFIGLNQKPSTHEEKPDLFIVPRMNLQGSAPLNLQNLWNPPALPSIDPQILRSIGNNLPYFQQPTFPTLPPFSLPNLASLTQGTLPFNLFNSPESRASEKIQAGLNNNFIPLPQLPSSLSILNTPSHPISTINSPAGPITSFFQGIGNSLATLTSQNRMRRQLDNNSYKTVVSENTKSNMHHISSFIPANILRSRLPYTVALNNKNFVAPHAKQIQRSNQKNTNINNLLLHNYKLPHILYNNRAEKKCINCKNENLKKDYENLNLFRIQNQEGEKIKTTLESFKKHAQPLHHRKNNLSLRSILNSNVGKMPSIDNKSLKKHNTIARKKNRRRPLIIMDENGNAYIQKDDTSSLPNKNKKNFEWPDEYIMEQMGSATRNNMGNEDWPLNTTVQSNYHETTHNNQAPRKASRSKRNVDESSIDMDKHKNSLTYRFKKWEAEDKSENSKIDAIYKSMIIDKIWKKKLYAKLLSKDQVPVTKITTTTTTTSAPLVTSTEKPKINMKRLGGAIHRLVFYPIIKGADHVFCSLQNFLNGKRGGG